MAATDKRELWVEWTHQAMSKYTPPEGKIDDEELVDDMVDVTTKYADSMLDEFEERFKSGDGERSATRARRRKEKPEED